jgi:hypothetical protein
MSSSTSCCHVMQTRDQVLEWLSFELGPYGGCDGDNPLAQYDVEAMAEPTLTDSGQYLRESVEVTRSDETGLYTRTLKKLQDEPSDLPPAEEQHSALVLDHYNSHVKHA